MVTIKGKYNSALVYTDRIDDLTVSQILELCNQEFSKGSKIRIMPDVHAGKGCVIGTTMTISDKVVPNLVGVDIGCGVRVAALRKKRSGIDLKKLDEAIYNVIPSGFNVRKKVHEKFKDLDLSKLRCAEFVDLDRAALSIGTLGGGNHFIELDVDKEDNFYLIVHSGSRNLGKQVAEYYQKLAYSRLTKNRDKIQEVIEELRRNGCEKDIQKSIIDLKSYKVTKDLAWLEGSDFDDYLHDIALVQVFASFNRGAISDEIEKAAGFSLDYAVETIHNYIDVENKILRKGAVSARALEPLVIPMNMRDGNLLCVGKGNPEWNYSAPHGAGRLFSRSEAKQQVNLEEFQNSMKGIFSTSIKESTLDESPMAYKPMDEIVAQIKDTVQISAILRPVYNFKAS